MKKHTKEYYIDSIKLCKNREFMGGVKTVESSLFKSSINGLMELGLTKEDIIEICKKIEAE